MTTNTTPTTSKITKVTRVDEGAYYFNSSALEYGKIDNDTVTLKLTNGRVYKYYDVEPETWIGLLSANSAGKFFNEHIRNQHGYKLIEERPYTRHINTLAELRDTHPGDLNADERFKLYLMEFDHLNIQDDDYPEHYAIAQEWYADEYGVEQLD